MIVGIPKEVMSDEYRVALLPQFAQQLVAHGHRVVVEHNAGLEAGFEDETYLAAGCEIFPSSEQIYEQAKLIIKVKAPLIDECELLTEEHILFSFLHLASNKTLTESLLNSKCTAIAYESICANGKLPILEPMSAIAGQLSIQFGAAALMSHTEGKGVLIGNITNAPAAKIVVLGGGIVGKNAIIVADAMQAGVVAVDISKITLENINKQFNGRVKTCLSTWQNIAREVSDADLIIGAAFLRDDRSPVLLDEKSLKLLNKNTVLLDVGIDQGGCFATSRPTTHSKPSYKHEDIIHCCVGNLPGCVPVTSSHALCAAIFPYVQKLSEIKLVDLTKNEILANGVNICQGVLTNMTIGNALHLDVCEINKVIK